MNKETLKAHFADWIEQISCDQLEHFALTCKQIAQCYQSTKMHAVLLLQNDEEETQSVYAINAEQEQAAEMVGMLADAMQKVGTGEGGQLN